MISKALDYALRALVFMARNPDQEYFGVNELAEKAQVSRTYLGKILQNLARQGYLNSTTGPRGGFSLAKDPKKVTVMELMDALEDENLKDKCFLGLAECSDTNPCPIHLTWKKCRASILSDFKKITIKDASKKAWPEYR